VPQANLLLPAGLAALGANPSSSSTPTRWSIDSSALICVPCGASDSNRRPHARLMTHRGWDFRPYQVPAQDVKD
jgi:hypothetical protein